MQGLILVFFFNAIILFVDRYVD